MRLNETHDPTLRSWVESANAAGADFPLQNLPFGSFRRAGSTEAFRIGVAIGDQLFDVAAAAQAGLLGDEAGIPARACGEPDLNRLLEQGPAAWSTLRLALSRLLRMSSPSAATATRFLLAQSTAEFSVAPRIGDYTDFYSSIYHATAVGRMFRPDEPLLPNYRWVPIGYHGRASSIGVSGESFPRPSGQKMPKGLAVPVVGPSRRMDYELELGVVVGVGNARGSPIPIATASEHVFGLCLLNDWSARDVQGWEYQPLGPFLGKNFATTISPWIVTLEALRPFRTAATRPAGEPAPLEYLTDAADQALGAYDIALEVAIDSARMRASSLAPFTLSRSNFRHAYWTLAQLVAHHTLNGCNLQSGDLLGTGTLSGPEPAEAGSLLELTRAGTIPIALPGGEERSFLEDGDRVLLRGWCAKPGANRIGFGECAGTVLPAR